MNRNELLKQINRIRIGSKWTIKNKQDRSYYINIGQLTLEPHEHVTVDVISMTDSNLQITVSHKSGYISTFSFDRFDSLFDEIVYPDVILKAYVDYKELFLFIKKEFNINLNTYYNQSTRAIQINDTTFDAVVNYLEKHELIERIISKKEADYVKHGKAMEHRTYGISKGNIRKEK